MSVYRFVVLCSSVEREHNAYSIKVRERSCSKREIRSRLQHGSRHIWRVAVVEHRWLAEESLEHEGLEWDIYFFGYIQA